MNTFYEKLLKCAEEVDKKISFRPEIGLTLGSGLGDYAETMQIEETLESDGKDGGKKGHPHQRSGWCKLRFPPGKSHGDHRSYHLARPKSPDRAK